MGTEAQVTMMVDNGVHRPRSVYKSTIKPEDLANYLTPDQVPRVVETWGEDSFNLVFEHGYEFSQLICDNCRGVKFEFYTLPDMYMSIAKCCNCGKYFEAYSG